MQFGCASSPQSPDQPLAITDNTVPPGFPGPVRHRHDTMTDIFFVLEGELAFEFGGERRIVGPGSFVLERVAKPVLDTLRNVARVKHPQAP